jgi:hypothetical protein
LTLSRRQLSSHQPLTDLKYPATFPDKKRQSIRERQGQLGMPWVSRPLETALMFLLVIAGVLVVAVVVAAVKILSLGWIGNNESIGTI